jgi:hypothetical protein
MLYFTFGYIVCLMTYAPDTRMGEFLLHFVPVAAALVIGDTISGMLFKRGDA